MPPLLNSRPQTGLSFLAPEPEDLEDLYSRYKVCNDIDTILCITVFAQNLTVRFICFHTAETSAGARVFGSAGGIH